MLKIDCPICGRCNETEFTYGGAAAAPFGYRIEAGGS